MMLIMLMSLRGVAQDSLITLNDAVRLAVQNNYDVRIAANNASVARNNFSIGNAGMLPQIYLNASKNYSLNNVNQTYNTGSEVNKSGVTANSTAAGGSLNWTLFDGFRMFANYDRLHALSDIGEISLEDRVNNTVSDVIRTYYDVVRQQQFLVVTQSAIDVARQRNTLARRRFELGAASKLDYLQSQVDLNRSLSALQQQNLALKQARINLNTLLARDASTPVLIRDSMLVTYKPTYDDLKNKTLTNSPTVRIAQRNVDVGRGNLRVAQSFYYPQINFNLGYNYSVANNGTGLLLYNQSRGLNATISATFTLFNGFNIQRGVRNERLNLSNYQLQYQSTQNTVNASLLYAYEKLQTDLAVLDTLESNYRMARENVNVSLEKYKLGAMSDLDLKQVQQSYEEAGNEVVNQRYAAKLDEIELMRLSAQLSKR